MPVRRADPHMGLAQMGARMGSVDDPTRGKPALELEQILDTVFSITGNEGRRRYDEAKRRRQEQIDRIAFKRVSQELREAFEQTENPLLVWIAIRHCADRGKQLPKWIMEYLTGSADALIELTLDPPKEVGVAVARALGFRTSGRGNPFSSFKKYQRCEKIALSFARKVLDGEKPSEATKQVAEEIRLSETLVWEELRKFYRDPPKLVGRKKWKPFIERLSEHPEFQLLLLKTHD